MTTTPTAFPSADPQGREEIIRELVRIGHEAIAVENDAELDAYFAEDFVFHSPDGDFDYAGLKGFFAAMRAAFTGFSVTRGIVFVQGQFVAAQTTMAGVFDHEFTHSPVGPLPPTGEPFMLRLINIFRYNNDGRLAEEWVQYDNRDVLRQLGAAGR